MRIGTDMLIVKALTALEEVGWQAQKAPIPPSFALRFTLAYLFAHGDGHRESFDEFWRIVTDTGDHHQSTPTRTNVVRSSYANRELYGIYKSVGVDRSTDMMFSCHRRRKREKADGPI